MVLNGSIMAVMALNRLRTRPDVAPASMAAEGRPEQGHYDITGRKVR